MLSLKTDAHYRLSNSFGKAFLPLNQFNCLLNKKQTGSNRNNAPHQIFLVEGNKSISDLLNYSTVTKLLHDKLARQLKYRYGQFYHI